MTITPDDQRHPARGAARQPRRSADGRGEQFTWTTPKDLQSHLERMWQRGDLLRASLADLFEAVRDDRQAAAPLFPLEIRLRRPTAREIAADFGRVMDWVGTLREASRSPAALPTADHGHGVVGDAGRAVVEGSGYELRWQRISSRVHGANDLPVAAVFLEQADALRFIRRQREAERARAVAQTIVTRQPTLAQWIARHPLVMLQHEAEWPDLLSVLDWFVANPRPGLYLRELDIPGVDTKFIEVRRGLLLELLDLVLPEHAIDEGASGVRNFAMRYGLRSESPLIRFRLLDPALHIHGISDVSVPAEQFAHLFDRRTDGFSRTAAALRRVFITENRINGLSFPEQPGSLVIFGLGYGVEQLADMSWLHDVELWYWGDIDTHGFGILNRLRAGLPGVHSLMMDRATLMAHERLWVNEPQEKRYTGDPTGLTPDEYTLFDDLRRDRLGTRVRLEQERISYGWVRRALAAMACGTGSDQVRRGRLDHLKQRR